MNFQSLSKSTDLPPLLRHNFSGVSRVPSSSVVLSILPNQNLKVSKFWENSEDCTPHTKFSGLTEFHPMHVLFSLQQQTQVGTLDIWSLSLHTVSSSVFCPTISSCLSFSKIWSFSSTQQYHQPLLESALSVLLCEKYLSAECQSGHSSYLICLPTCRNHNPVLPVLREYSCFIQLTQLSICLQWKASLALVTVSGQKTTLPAYSFYLIPSHAQPIPNDYFPILC